MREHLSQLLTAAPWGLVLLACGAIAFLTAWNAQYPIRRFSFLASFSFLSGWLTGELAFHHVLWQSVVVGVCIYGGALEDGVGWVGLGLCLAAWALLLRLHNRGQLAMLAADDAVADAFSEEDSPAVRASTHPIAFRDVALPFKVKHPAVRRVRKELFAEVDGAALRMDIYHPRTPVKNAPVLLFIHGGAWVIGYKDRQALPLFARLASRGWVCLSADYRLSPRATFPDHIQDVKRAIVWTKSHVARFGGDPSFIAISGNSAGGHLASLAALTPNLPVFQPGFESADTSVQACVAFYGVYDWLNRFGQWPHNSLRPFLERVVVKASMNEREDLFRLGSPIEHVREDAPPFCIIHGDKDSLVPVEEGRAFARELRKVSHETVMYCEVPDAQHAFDMFRSVRAHYALRAVETFLNTVRARAQSSADGETACIPTAAPV